MSAVIQNNDSDSQRKVATVAITDAERELIKKAALVEDRPYTTFIRRAAVAHANAVLSQQLNAS